MRPWYAFNRFLLNIVTRSLFNVTAHNPENVPLEGGVLLLANHQSNLDPTTIGMCLPREVDYLAKESLFKNPIAGKFLRSVNAYPVNIDNKGDIQAMKNMIKQLKDDRVVMIFPEGTRSFTGEMTTLKGGFDLIIRKSKVPIVPVIIHGTHQCLARKNGIQPGKNIDIHYGKPLNYSDLSHLDRKGLVNHIQTILFDMHNDALKQLHQVPYPYHNK